MERTKKPTIQRTKESAPTRTKKAEPLVRQIKKNSRKIVTQEEYDGVFNGNNISTGSTLLDLAISGGRVRGGGLPAGVLVEIFGPSGSGKTVLLSEIAGYIQRQGGQIKFHDPEARLNKQFAKMFDFDLDEDSYYRPNTVPEVFKPIREWDPPREKNIINGIMADSLAALSTDLEMESEDGDKMGMRRAKEFSEELRKTCRILAQNNYLMVCSNQVRINMDGGRFTPKYTTPGGESVAFYASCRLKTQIVKKLKKKHKFHGKDVEKVIGVQIDVEVFKNSIWKPFRTAPVTIIFDYGIDNIRENLQYIKTYSGKTTYTVGNVNLSKIMNNAIEQIEEKGWEERLRQEVILLWNKIERSFDSNRKKKRR